MLDPDTTAEAPVEPSAAPAPPAAAPTAPVIGVFRNRFGHWRGGWRILLYLVALLAFGWGAHAIMAVVGLDLSGGLETWPAVVRSARQCLVLIGAAALLLRWVDERPIAALGLGFEPGWGGELAVGAAAGFGLASAVVLVLVATGRAALSWTPTGAFAALPQLLLLFVFAGAAEELVFRGYVLQALGEATRPWLAAVALCLAFAAVHLDNPDVSRLGVLNIFVIGLLLAAGYLLTRRLWLPIGLHAAFNLTQGWLWGFDVSGIDVQHTLLTAVPAGPDLVTGGGFGIEGSVITTIVVGAVLGWTLVARAVRPGAQVAALWQRYPAGFGLPPTAPAAPRRAVGTSPGEDAGNVRPRVGEASALDAGGVLERPQEVPQPPLAVAVEVDETGAEAVDPVPLGDGGADDPQETVDGTVGQSEGEAELGPDRR